jgi:ABC-type lipoprotein release transport system permease subunit
MDLFAPQYKESLERFTEEADLSELSGDSVVVGAKLKKLIESIYGSDTLSLAMPDGSYRNFNIKGVFSADTALESSDMILMDKEAAKELLGLQEGYCTDIAVNVANPSEVDMVSMKITNMFPDVRVVLKKR